MYCLIQTKFSELAVRQINKSLADKAATMGPYPTLNQSQMNLLQQSSLFLSSPHGKILTDISLCGSEVRVSTMCFNLIAKGAILPKG